MTNYSQGIESKTSSPETACKLCLISEEINFETIWINDLAEIFIITGANETHPDYPKYLLRIEKRDSLADIFSSGRTQFKTLIPAATDSAFSELICEYCTSNYLSSNGITRIVLDSIAKQYSELRFAQYDTPMIMRFGNDVLIKNFYPILDSMGSTYKVLWHIPKEIRFKMDMMERELQEMWIDASQPLNSLESWRQTLLIEWKDWRRKINDLNCAFVGIESRDLSSFEVEYIEWKIVKHIWLIEVERVALLWKRLKETGDEEAYLKLLQWYSERNEAGIYLLELDIVVAEVNKSGISCQKVLESYLDYLEYTDILHENVDSQIQIRVEEIIRTGADLGNQNCKNALLLQERTGKFNID
ncbi:MAG: hypothetical protein GQ574_22760 [Crocinitomix sp.]|nr:hypothetical protein [Crocinitomix sp.]